MPGAVGVISPIKRAINSLLETPGRAEMKRGGGNVNEKKQIGWYNLKEDTVFTNASFETAAWYERVLVKAGKYPVEVSHYKVRDNGIVDGWANSAYIYMDGVITEDYFPSLFFGNVVTDYDTTKNAGKASVYRKMPYLYQIAGSILKDAETPYELLPEYEARVHRFTYDGEQHEIAELFYVGTKGEGNHGI